MEHEKYLSKSWYAETILQIFGIIMEDKSEWQLCLDPSMLF